MNLNIIFTLNSGEYDDEILLVWLKLHSARVFIVVLFVILLLGIESVTQFTSAWLNKKTINKGNVQSANLTYSKEDDL